jgi:hypothetical protein
MKKLLILALFVGLLTSCMHPTYRAKDRYGKVVHIIDPDGEVESAIELELDSISVYAGAFDDFYRPSGYLHRDTTMFYSSYVDGVEYAGYLEYKIVKVKDIHKR